MKGPEDDAGLTGKVAILSGGGAAGEGIGNGRAAAILLARAGTKVLVADRDQKLAERTVEMIQAEGGTAAAYAGAISRCCRRPLGPTRLPRQQCRHRQPR
jgi:NAD(P)-dependent dehydrogenase (short-subunit alcohol dehydrogenase family)